MNSEEGQGIIYRKPVGLTITLEKIDRVLADVKTQIETLRQITVNLRLALVRLPHGNQVGKQTDDATLSSKQFVVSLEGQLPRCLIYD